MLLQDDLCFQVTRNVDIIVAVDVPPLSDAENRRGRVASQYFRARARCPAKD